MRILKYSLVVFLVGLLSSCIPFKFESIQGSCFIEHEPEDWGDNNCSVRLLKVDSGSSQHLLDKEEDKSEEYPQSTSYPILQPFSKTVEISTLE
jgi:hypothetical protein